MKNIFIQIFCTKIGWLFICLFFTILSGCFSTNNNFGFKGYELCNYIMMASLVYPVILFIIMVVHAFIINPLKHLKK